MASLPAQKGQGRRTLAHDLITPVVSWTLRAFRSDDAHDRHRIFSN